MFIYSPDSCAPDQMCDYVPPQQSRDRRSSTTDVDIDMAFVMDSSETTYPTVFTEIKRYVAHIVEQLEVSSDPMASIHHARVAVIQQAPYEFLRNSSGSPIRVDVGLTDHLSAQDIHNFLLDKTPQLEGGRALAAAIEHTVEQVFERAPHQRDLKVLTLFVTGPVEEDEERLVAVATEAKCKGYFLVILGVGEKLSAGDARVMMRMASEPSDVFFKRLTSTTHFYDKHIQNFGRLLPKYLSSECIILHCCCLLSICLIYVNLVFTENRFFIDKANSIIRLNAHTCGHIDCRSGFNCGNHLQTPLMAFLSG